MDSLLFFSLLFSALLGLGDLCFGSLVRVVTSDSVVRLHLVLMLDVVDGTGALGALAESGLGGWVKVWVDEGVCSF